MEPMRIAASDEAALTARIELAVAAAGRALAVSRHVLWYTTRPPVHVAILRQPSPGQGGCGDFDITSTR
jgi:hypothetical protein